MFTIMRRIRFPDKTREILQIPLIYQVKIYPETTERLETLVLCKRNTSFPFGAAVSNRSPIFLSRRIVMRFFFGNHLPAGLRTAAALPAIFGAAVLLGGSIQTAHAQNLFPGGSVGSVSSFNSTAGFTLVDQQAINGSSNFGGLILNFVARSAVYRSNTDGELAFLYQVTNLGSSNDSVGRFTAGPFGLSDTTNFQFATNDADGAGIFIAGSRQATTADRSLNGSIVGFNFQPTQNYNFLKLEPGQTSAIMALDTNVKEYQIGQISVIDGVATTVQGFAPKTSGKAIPEPGTLALLAPALLGGVAMVSRRRKK